MKETPNRREMVTSSLIKGTVSRDRFGFGGLAWSLLGLNRGHGQFLNFFGAPMIL